jgi:hypothetical protein
LIGSRTQNASRWPERNVTGFEVRGKSQQREDQRNDQVHKHV